MIHNSKIEEIISEHGEILEMTVGDSMRPMLKSRTNPIVIGKVISPPKRNDVVLYKLNNAKYVLHRIIAVKDTHYVIRGDNCYITERVPKNDIIGVLLGYYKGDGYIDCYKNRLYKLYVFAIRVTYIFRYVFWRIKNILYRLFKRCKNGK